MTNPGRIGCLSKAIREQINHRLLNGDSDGVILNWLHTLGEVWALIQQRFQHAAFTSRDLDEWRTGAFAEWKLRREVALAAQGPALDYSTDGQLKSSARQVADHLAEILAGHYARLMHHWDGDATEEFTVKLRALTHLCRDICALRKSEHQAALIKLAEAKHALRQKQFPEATEAAFLKRLDQPGLRERILHHYNNTPSSEPTAQSPEPTAHVPAPSPRSRESNPIKPNQASSGVGPSRPDTESSAAPASTAPPPSSIPLAIRPNPTHSGVGTVSCNLLPSDYPDPGHEAPDIYSIPNPAIAARLVAPKHLAKAETPQKEEPIVRGFVPMVNYGPSERRNDVHY